MSKYWARRFKNVLITGLPASGKSSFARAYAHHSGRNFLDFDALLEHHARKSIAEIFAQDGEEGFRRFEDKILRRIGRYHNYVIALGGGTLNSDDNLQFARKLGLIVFLQTPIANIVQRIERDKQMPKARVRPLFASLATPELVAEKVQELWEIRQPFYEEADVILNTEFSTNDTLKLQLGLVERKSNNRHYMDDVRAIMQIEKEAQAPAQEETQEQEQNQAQEDVQKGNEDEQGSGSEQL